MGNWFDDKRTLKIKGGFIRRELTRAILKFELKRREKARYAIKHPGKVIRDEILNPRNIDSLEFSEMMGDSPLFGKEFMDGNVGINYELDKKISKVLGVPKGHFLSLQEEWTEKSERYLSLLSYLAWMNRP